MMSVYVVTYKEMEGVEKWLSRFGMGTGDILALYAIHDLDEPVAHKLKAIAINKKFTKQQQLDDALQGILTNGR